MASHLKDPLLAECGGQSRESTDCTDEVEGSSGEEPQESTQKTSKVPEDSGDSWSCLPCHALLKSPSGEELLKMLKHVDIQDSRDDQSPAYSVVSETLYTALQDLLGRLRKQPEDGFADTRILQEDPGFFDDILEGVFQLILTHSCVVLGPSGCGKTTLVNTLADADFVNGPLEDHRTSKVQSCDLRLEGLPAGMNVVLIDTPGWNHNNSTNIKSEYKIVLKERELPSEHTPHIILLCISVSNIRQFNDEEAEKMSEQLEELRFDQRFPIKVLPVATCADAQDGPGDLEKCMGAIKKLAEKAFESTGAEVQEPMWTTFRPRNEEGTGWDELKDRIREILCEQIRSSEFSGLWQLALAKRVVKKTQAHIEKFPANDSALRLFQKAFSTVATACGKELPDRASFEQLTARYELDNLPWNAILQIPLEKGPKTQETHAQTEEGPNTQSRSLHRSGKYRWRQLMHTCGRVMKCEGRHVGASSLRKFFCSRTGLRRICVFLLLLLLLLLAWHSWDLRISEEVFSRMEKLKEQNAQFKETNEQLTEKLSKTQEKLKEQNAQLKKTKERLTGLTACKWNREPNRCTGLWNLGAADTKKKCKQACCDLGADNCQTWQYQDNHGCWLGNPTECTGSTGWEGGSLAAFHPAPVF